MRPAAGAAPALRSAVLFIADGVGPAHVTATRVARRGSTGSLRLDRMPHTAVLRTHSADSPVTDSAAAATALGCGVKTPNEVVCMEPAAGGLRRRDSIAVWAKRRGLRVGLVTTTRVTHATPAAFYATIDDRDAERAIARAAIGSGLDFILGGGRVWFGPSRPDSAWDDAWPRGDADDLLARARGSGWTVAATAAELRAITRLDRRVLGLFATSHLPYQAEARPGRDWPTLLEMTAWAIDRLRDTGEPFFLMIEAGKPDHAAHENWALTLLDEMESYDASIGLAMDRLDPETTLLLATSDHETGGLAINGYPEEKDGILGTYAPEKGAPYSVLSFATGPGKDAVKGAPHGAADPRPSGVIETDAAHTGVDVILYAWGAGAERVHGTLENTAVHDILKDYLSGAPSAGSNQR